MYQIPGSAMEMMGAGAEQFNSYRSTSFTIYAEILIGKKPHLLNACNFNYGERSWSAARK